MVIKMKENMSITTKFDLPTHCEYCGSKLEWDSVNLVCNNPNCNHIENERLKAWCMNLAPIDGLGWKTITKCLENSYYRYHYDNKRFDMFDIMNLEQIPGVTYGKGEQGTFNQMLDILQHGTFKLSQFLLALNIPGLGKISAKRWEEAGNARYLCDCIATCTIYSFDSEYDQLLTIIQDKNVVNSLLNEYNKHFRECYELIFDRIITSCEEQVEETSFKGKVVITGSLSIKRSEFEIILEKNGWELINNLTKDVKYLITNTPDSGTTKNKKADELNITKITEEDFIRNVLKN